MTLKGWTHATAALLDVAWPALTLYGLALYRAQVLPPLSVSPLFYLFFTTFFHFTPLFAHTLGFEALG